jgi:cysteinyl-tRNA synthetase
MRHRHAVTILAGLTLLAATVGPAAAASSGLTARKMTLDAVKHWGYNIQRVHSNAQYDQLVDSHFDLYVLEVVVTEKGMEGYDIAGLVHDVRRHNIEVRGVDPIILAYVDIGQAEDWRWYWKDHWGIGTPEWIVGDDPNDWEGNYPVAYWYPAWEKIAIYGRGGQSHVQATLDAGFDGIYMDWVEAFSDGSVVGKVMEDFRLNRKQARAKAAALMLGFIGKIRNFARKADPDYLVVAQNASDLYQTNPKRYRRVIDAIALEAIWYDGDNDDGDGDGPGAFDAWGDPAGYNLKTNSLYPGWTQEVLADLEGMGGRLPVFCAEYAQDRGGKMLATKVYRDLAPGVCVPYATQRALAKLSTSPYPRGYHPKDYSKPPGRPRLQVPTDGSTIGDRTPVFDWADASGYPVQYRLQVDDNRDFSSPRIDLRRAKSGYVPSSTLPRRTLHWRVRAKDAAGDWSRWSRVSTFTID